MSTYSFKDTVSAIEGPGGNINLADGAGVAQEGITITPTGDKSTMTIGADGSGMHSLSADDSVSATIRLLKTSPTNALLMQMYNYQTLSSTTHGKNNITVRDIARGDFISLEQAAFKRRPDLSYAAEGGLIEWQFDAIVSNAILGAGSPEL